MREAKAQTGALPERFIPKRQRPFGIFRRFDRAAICKFRRPSPRIVERKAARSAADQPSNKPVDR